MAEGVFGRSKQLSQNRFFDPSTPSLRKADDREKRKREIMSFIVATNVVDSQPPERRPSGTPTAHDNTQLGTTQLKLV